MARQGNQTPECFQDPVTRRDPSVRCSPAGPRLGEHGPHPSSISPLPPAGGHLASPWGGPWSSRAPPRCQRHSGRSASSPRRAAATQTDVRPTGWPGHLLPQQATLGGQDGGLSVTSDPHTCWGCSRPRVLAGQRNPKPCFRQDEDPGRQMCHWTVCGSPSPWSWGLGGPTSTPGRATGPGQQPWPTPVTARTSAVRGHRLVQTGDPGAPSQATSSHPRLHLQTLGRGATGSPTGF